jgi:hypothetical protein
VLAETPHGDQELPRRDIDPHQDRFPDRIPPLYDGLLSPDPAPSPTALVDAGSRALDTPRHGRRGRGAHPPHRLTASVFWGLPGNRFIALDILGAIYKCLALELGRFEPPRAAGPEAERPAVRRHFD